MTAETDDYYHHISQQFNDDLEKVKSQILAMGGLVEKQVKDAVDALVDSDSALAESVQSSEIVINTMDVAIDEECTRILALRQPAASDLRLVVTIGKAISDLERMGDEANKIARLAGMLAEQGRAPRGNREVRHIGKLVLEMIHNALDAFARFDLEVALRVAQADKAVDLEYESAMRQLVTFMMEDPRSISSVLNVIWALRALERIGDHARNIAEHTVYLVKGANVKHTSLEEMAKSIRS